LVMRTAELMCNTAPRTRPWCERSAGRPARVVITRSPSFLRPHLDNEDDRRRRAAAPHGDDVGVDRDARHCRAGQGTSQGGESVRGEVVGCIATGAGEANNASEGACTVCSA
jgi:hypothetical protein